MKKINITKLIVLGIFFTSLYSHSQERVWEQTDSFLSQEVWGDKVGENVKVDITCAAPSVQEALLEARKRALYTYLFVSFDAEGSGSSGISKLLSSSDYEKDIEFFTDYINQESKGLKYTEAKINTAKPGGEVKEDRKKLYKITATVTLKIPQIQKDLEEQGKLKSMGNLKDLLGDITVIVKPNDLWLKAMGALTEDSALGKKIFKRDYEKLQQDRYYNLINQSITANLGEGFTIIDIATKMEEINNHNTSSSGNQYEQPESEDDFLARTLNADLYLEVLFDPVKIEGGNKTQLNIALTGIDTYKGDRAIPGKTMTNETTGDNYTALVQNLMKSAINEFKPKALEFLTKRNEKGIQGIIRFNFLAELEGKYNFNTMIPGKASFKDCLFKVVSKLSGGKCTLAGVGSQKELVYNVTLPPKLKDFAGDEVKSNFDLFATNVITELQKYIPEVNGQSLQQGLGKVLISFKN
jgi:hypothetical protein